MSVDTLSPPLTDSTGDAVGGFWAVQPDPNDDPQHRDGRLTTNTALAPFGTYYTFGSDIQGEFGVTQMDQYSLFRFQFGTSSGPAPFYPSTMFLNRIYAQQGGVLAVGSCSCSDCPLTDAQPFCATQTSYSDPGRLVVQDLGHYQFKLQYVSTNDLSGPLDYEWSEFAEAVGSATLWHYLVAEYNSYTTTTGPFHVVFRYFPDGNVPALADGEVALYEKCNYQGKAIVLGSSLANFLEWNSNIVLLDKLGASIRLGNNTAITYYGQPNFQGDSESLTLDAACLANPPKIASVQVESAASILLSSRKCVNCRLNGANLAGADLTGVDLSSAQLTGAVLSQAVLSNAILRQANLSHAKLYGAVLDGANLESANLQSAYLTNSPPDGINQAASLTSAFLRNVNLSFAQISGANFSNANFYGTNGIDGTSCGIDADGQTDGCATAHNAVMNNTVFSGAYLFGVDFTGAQATGAIFDNSILVGANFNGATLGSDSAATTTTSFDSAFLQGATLAGATLDHVSFNGAFVDFNPNGNTLDIRLPGSHTTFAGYWRTPGQPVCAEPGYAGPTTAPATNTTITCPDGSKNGCGAADPSGASQHWRSRADISASASPASYENDATYTRASATPICADDPDWDVGGSSQPLGGQQPSPGKRGHRHQPPSHGKSPKGGK